MFVQKGWNGLVRALFSFMKCFRFALVVLLVSLCSLVSLYRGRDQRTITCLRERQRFYPLPTVRGLHERSPRIVVYRHVTGGFANNIMGLVTSYVYAMWMNAVLYCMLYPSLQY